MNILLSFFFRALPGKTRCRLGAAIGVVTLLSSLEARLALGQEAKPEPVRVLVAYYSLTGNTEQMAGGVVDGARRVAGVQVTLKKVETVSKEDLETADAIVLGCPTHFGNIPGRMKVIIDDWSWKMKVDFTDKIGGAFSTGGGQVGGKEFVVMQLVVFML